MPYFRFEWTDDIVAHLAEKRERNRRLRDETTAEAADLTARADRRVHAAQEPSISGQLRQAVRASGFRYAEIADRSQIEVGLLADFMTGDARLDSDAFDRLAAALGCELTTAR